MRTTKALTMILMLAGVAAIACTPRECKQYRECCAALAAVNPQMAPACAAAEQLNDASACTQATSGLRLMAGPNVPAQCGGPPTATAAAPAAPAIPGMPAAPPAAGASACQEYGACCTALAAANPATASSCAQVQTFQALGPLGETACTASLSAIRQAYSQPGLALPAACGGGVGGAVAAPVAPAPAFPSPPEAASAVGAKPGAGETNVK